MIDQNSLMAEVGWWSLKSRKLCVYEREGERELLGWGYWRFLDKKTSVTVDSGGGRLYLILLCFLRGEIIVYYML
jgi:hypothetical protein